MLGVTPSLIVGIIDTRNATCLHLLLFADIAIGILVMTSFVVVRMLKKFL